MISFNVRVSEKSLSLVDLSKLYCATYFKESTLKSIKRTENFARNYLAENLLMKLK